MEEKIINMSAVLLLTKGLQMLTTCGDTFPHHHEYSGETTGCKVNVFAWILENMSDWKKKKSVKVFLVEKGFWTYPRRVTPQPLWKICVNVQSTWPKSPFFTVKSISWCSDGTSCSTVRVHCLWSSQWTSPKAVLPFHLVVNLTYLRLSWRATSPAHTSKTLPPKGSTNICVTEDLGVLLMLTEVDLLVKAVIYKPWKRRR